MCLYCHSSTPNLLQGALSKLQQSTTAVEDYVAKVQFLIEVRPYAMYAMQLHASPPNPPRVASMVITL